MLHTHCKVLLAGYPHLNRAKASTVLCIVCLKAFPAKSVNLHDMGADASVTLQNIACQRCLCTLHSKTCTAKSPRCPDMHLNAGLSMIDMQD